jgi:hypothetical protein
MKVTNQILVLLFLPAFMALGLRLEAQQYFERLDWEKDGSAMFALAPNATGLYFDHALIDEDSGLPLFMKVFRLQPGFSSYEAIWVSQEFEALSDEELKMLPEGFAFPGEIRTDNIIITQSRRQPYAELSFIPLRKNPVSGEIEKLTSFEVLMLGKGSHPVKTANTYPEASVLSAGNWLKVRTTEAGVYKITFEELLAAGLPVQGIDPSLIRMHGNGNRVLPEKNDEARIRDLREISIEVISADETVFAPGDFILFYASSPNGWKANLTPFDQRFEHQWNVYSNHSWHFITVGNEPGLRVQSKQHLNQPGSHQVRTFSDYRLYKPDVNNLARIGREWYGERIFGASGINELTNLHFPHLDTNEYIRVRSRFAVKANEPSRVKLFVDGNELISNNVPAIPIENISLYARVTQINEIFKVGNESVSLSLEYMNSNSTASSWVDFVELNARRNMIFTAPQLLFRDLLSVGSNYTGQFMLEEVPENLFVWEITEEHQPENILINPGNGKVQFTLPTKILREFVAFTHEGALAVEAIVAVDNQNLHSLDAHDFIIVAPHSLMEPAMRFAELRRTTSNLSVLVVDIDHIYNEFASGSLDPTAIRDFMKMLYDRAPAGSEPKYLLLFGDGSYDPKDRIPGNNNHIPTYQSAESLRLDLSFVTDDYYGLLEDGEGLGCSGSLDIGIGRFPVNTVEEANVMIDKIEFYLSNQGKNRGHFQNSITYVAHDEDRDAHFLQAEELVEFVAGKYGVFNIEKIYLDAYQRVYVPGGFRYPVANQAIHDIVENGTMLVNYIGHGGETGWASSNVLTNSDILRWENINNMPLFLTATCQFGRFDNPQLVSAGELVVKNPKGGGIALFTTSRLAYSSFNFRLNKSFTAVMFERDENGKYYPLGDLVRLSKNDNSNNQYIRNFVLLGDPSLTLIYPDYEVVTTSLTNSRTGESSSELEGLTEVTIKGYIADFTGDTVSSYNGILKPIVYDKAETLTTLANDPGSIPRNFTVQKTILYQGQVSIENGRWEFSFIVPRDVRPRMGKGKISYFASDGTTEAHGYYDDFEIGGLNTEAATDQQGPAIELYLDNITFKSGDFTSPNPVMYADISDSGGINFFGLGIGHDIVAVLNENSQQPIILNNHFIPEMDTFDRGSITYSFYDLPEGEHRLRLKVWDLHNNSSEAVIDFVVTKNLQAEGGNLVNYPNPFSEGTWFRFEHNYFNEVIDVEINIYDIAGRQVKTIQASELTTNGSEISPVYWDGRADGGNSLGRGVYIYSILMRTASGQEAVLRGKLMKAR